MRRIRTVIKLGGSLLSSPTLVPLLESLGYYGPRAGALLVPGGGSLADEVRRLDRQIGLGDSAAHWMAILAMDQVAFLLTDRIPGSEYVARPEEAVAALVRGRLPVLAPFAWLRAADPLPHSWSVTADSIAAWVARVVDAERLLLLKSVSGRPARLTQRGAAGIVDDFFWQVVQPHMQAWMADGRKVAALDRLLEVFSREGTP